MSDVYGAWKPLRNLLNKLDVLDALGVVRAYSGWLSLQVKPHMPSDVEVNPAFYGETFVLTPWELETLAREAVIVCSANPAPTATFRKWNTLMSATDKLRNIEAHIVANHVGRGQLFQELTVRLPHRQFRYQTERPNTTNMVRYSKIFSHPDVITIFQNKTGLTPKQLYTIGTGLWFKYASQHLGMHYPLDNFNITGVDQADYDAFMALYSLPLEDIKAKLSDPAERALDDTFMYQYHSLHAFPIIFTPLNGRPTHICPLPTLLYWRITAGLYYDLCKERGFDQGFGASFESYIGEMLQKTLDGTGVTVYPEEPDTAPHRCDWIIDQARDFMLVECKTKRMTMGAKVTLKDDKELFEQLGKLGDAIVQAYQTYMAYCNHEYANQHYPFDPAKRAFVGVVTLEHWYLLGEQLMMLREIVKDKLANLGLDQDLIERVPYVVAAAVEFEKLAYLAKTHDLNDIIRPYWDDPEMSRWEFATYIFNNYKQDLENYTYIFDDERGNIFTVNAGQRS